MKWISVKEKMPPDYETVLLFIEYESQRVDPNTKERIGNPEKYNEIAIGHIHDDRLWIMYDQDGYYDVDKVTHWMPLPEDPQ